MAFIHNFRESRFEYLAITSSVALFGMLTGPFYSNLRQRQALLIYLSAERCWGSRNLGVCVGSQGRVCTPSPPSGKLVPGHISHAQFPGTAPNFFRKRLK